MCIIKNQTKSDPPIKNQEHHEEKTYDTRCMHDLLIIVAGSLELPASIYRRVVQVVQFIQSFEAAAAVNQPLTFGSRDATKESHL